jgi:FlgD Ig-like domain
VTRSIVYHSCVGACVTVLVSSVAFADPPANRDVSDRAADRAPRITEVAANPKLVAALDQEPVTISFRTNAQTQGEVSILDQWQRMVRRIILVDLPAGKHKVVWNGRDDSGRLCRGHRFTFLIRVADTSERTATYDPSSVDDGVEVKTRRFTFDDKTGQLSYTLPRPCMVRVRAGLLNGPMMRTLLDWEPQLAGPHDINWNGLDDSSGVKLMEHPDLNINLVAYALPLNVILVGQDSGDVDPKSANATPTSKNRSRRAGDYLHASCDPSTCHEPRFSIGFPRSMDVADNVPVVSGKTPLRIDIAPADAAYMISKRFEVMLYVDGIFVFEEEDGTSPLTYQWDTSTLVPGKHQVTVNIMSYDDHVGTVTRPVIVEQTK